MGTTEGFAVLAGSGNTNTGATTTGTKYMAAEAVVGSAKDDLVTAYDDAAGCTPVTTMSDDLGGKTLKEAFTTQTPSSSSRPARP